MAVAVDAIADPQGVTQNRASQVTQPRAQGMRQAPDGSETGEQVVVVECLYNNLTVLYRARLGIA